MLVPSSSGHLVVFDIEDGLNLKSLKNEKMMGLSLSEIDLGS